MISEKSDLGTHSVNPIPLDILYFRAKTIPQLKGKIYEDDNITLWFTLMDWHSSIITIFLYNIMFLI